MLYVLLILVVALAFTSGALYVVLKMNDAERRVEIARLTCKNKELEARIAELKRLSNVREGLK